jgi:hypothetical protein
MKRLLLVLFAFALLSGCKKADEVYVEDFTYSGCTKAETETVDLSLLFLKCEGEDLVVTRKDAWLNCSFENRGLVCTVSVKGDDVYYEVNYEKEGAEVKCVCLVETMSSLVKGLQSGKKYTFHYYCCKYYKPFSFTFRDGLVTAVDMSTITP